MSKNDGGAAFPCAAEAVGGNDGWLQEGMSLRDWFAGQALAGMHLPVYNTEGDYVYENMELIAKAAYWMADAMLAGA